MNANFRKCSTRMMGLLIGAGMVSPSLGRADACDVGQYGQIVLHLEQSLANQDRPSVSLERFAGERMESVVQIGSILWAAENVVRKFVAEADLKLQGSFPHRAEELARKIQVIPSDAEPSATIVEAMRWMTEMDLILQSQSQVRSTLLGTVGGSRGSLNSTFHQPIQSQIPDPIAKGAEFERAVERDLPIATERVLSERWKRGVEAGEKALARLREVCTEALIQDDAGRVQQVRPESLRILDQNIVRFVLGKSRASNR